MLHMQETATGYVPRNLINVKALSISSVTSLEKEINDF